MTRRYLKERRKPDNWSTSCCCTTIYCEGPILRSSAALGGQLHRWKGLKSIAGPKHLDKITRWQFIDGLVDAVEAAGGHLGLDRPNGRGTLDEAIKVLRPCLPKDAFRLGLSISTLKAIKAERAKKLQKTV
jgi:hypothetical protein